MKQSLLRWLSPLGTWFVHPMFTKPWDRADEFARFLDVRIVAEDVLHAETDRTAYFAKACSLPEHLFLDPNTGLRSKTFRGAKSPNYLFEDDLVSIADARPKWLTLVFDQSVARGKEKQQLCQKLSCLQSHGLSAVAYISHACFILVGRDAELVDRALAT
ncbi:hypothetical protein CH330_03560, partial [candidate division WOR-3 bacterium JGI_Cruoil_03_51_56]